MLDMLLVSVIGWTSLYGLSAGSLKLIIRFSTVIGLITGIWVIVPGLKESITNPSIKVEYFDWLQRLIQPLVPVVRIRILDIATSTNMYHITTISRIIFYRILFAGNIIAVFFGLWMLFYSIKTIWLESLKHYANQIFGLMLGIGIGFYIDGMLIKIMLFLSWAFQQNTIKQWIVQSLIANGWLHLLSNSFKL